MNGYVEVTAEEADALRAMGIEVHWKKFEWNSPHRLMGQVSCVRCTEALGSDYRFYIKAEQTGS